MGTPNTFLHIELDLPDNTEKLSEAEIKIEKFKERLAKLQSTGEISNKTHEPLYDETVLMLDYLGRLSKPVFGIEDIIESAYFKEYIAEPKKVKRLWYEHYEYIHHPYTILKNRCYSILEDLDEEFLRVNHCFPSNYYL
jgi:hypothetical protein